jgi:hypothetical protein
MAFVQKEVAMFCPDCRSEYRPGFTECASCGVRLVDSLAEDPEKGDPNLKLLTVFETSDAALIAMARSILESAQIPFIVANEAMQDYIGWGRFPGPMNIATGPVQIQVAEGDAEEAERLLSELEPTEDEAANGAASGGEA